MADALPDSPDVDDDLWHVAREELDERQLLDVFPLCGWYHAIGFAARAAPAARSPVHRRPRRLMWHVGE